MLYTHFATTAVAALSVLAAPVLGSAINIPPKLELDDWSMAKDVDIKFWTSLSCTTSEHQNGYNNGDCPNAEGRKSASMQKRKSTSCHMVRHEGENCRGDSEKGLNLHDCFSLKGNRWKSLLIQC